MYHIIQGVLSISRGIRTKLWKDDSNMSLFHLLCYTSHHHRRFLYIDGQTSYAQYERYTRRNARTGNSLYIKYNNLYNNKHYVFICAHINTCYILDKTSTSP